MPVAASSPPLRLLATEPVRAALEYARMRFMRRDALPRGERHPVVIFPGLATDRRFTAPLERHCSALGYSTFDWGRGVNRGPEGDLERWFDELASDVERLVRRHTRPPTLIGWSLGGIYAREIAKKLPIVRQVITIGAPFAGGPQHTNVAWLYRWMSGQAPVLDATTARRLRTPPPVPTTSIYSRSDGVVAWQACRGSASPRTENIEVESSHLGLVWHPDVLAIVADRLSQDADAWQPWSASRGTSKLARAA